MKFLRLLPAFLVLVFISCSTDGTNTRDSTLPAPTSETTIAEDSDPHVGKYRILKREIDDSRIKAQVLATVVIDERPVDQILVEAIMRRVYSNIAKEGPFKHHPHPTSIGVYAYADDARATSGMAQWLGMMLKTAVEHTPKVSFNEMQITATAELPTNRWGLTYDQRRELWTASILAEDETRHQADEKYPLSVSINHDRHTKFSKEQNKKAYAELASKMKIKPSLIDSISREGLINGWPFPSEK